MKRKRRHRKSSKRTRPRGFDFGCLPNVLTLASFEFPKHLTAASVDGVAYGFDWSTELDQRVPSISLVSRHGDELLKAFEEFNSWRQATDADSVELTLVFLKQGGYLLGISPEFTHLVRRCLGFDRAHRVVGVGPIWRKPIDSVHPNLQKIRDYCSSPISPFLLDGVTYKGPTLGPTHRAPSDVISVPGLQPLLKFEVTFIDEDRATPNSMAWTLLRMGSTERQSQKEEFVPGVPDVGDIAALRAKTLRHHFPVTLERIRRGQLMPNLLAQLQPQGVRSWQIEQALCNLVLSAELGHGLHYTSLGVRKAQTQILQGIGGRFELADGGEVPAFSTEDLTTQITADGNAMLRHFRKRKRKNLEGVQKALQSMDALKAPAVVAHR